MQRIRLAVVVTLVLNRATIVRFTTERRLPAISTSRSFVEQGLLLAYQEYTRDGRAAGRRACR